MIRLKTKEEIRNLREIGKRHNEILRALSCECLPGKSTDDVEKKAIKLIDKAGLEPAFLGYKPKDTSRPFPAVACVSVNEEIVHGVPNEDPRSFKEGDLVSIDIGLMKDGLVTDAALTSCVGKCTKEKNELNWVTEEALYKGIEATVSGGYVGDIGAAIFSFVRGTPFSLVRYLSGHGVGYSVHEDPFVPNINKKGTGPRLREGLVIAIEPMLTTGSGDITLSDNGFTYMTKEGTPSAHWEHTVAVTDKGPEVITG